jgi:hypothetical protein
MAIVSDVEELWLWRGGVEAGKCGCHHRHLQNNKLIFYHRIWRLHMPPSSPRHQTCNQVGPVSPVFRKKGGSLTIFSRSLAVFIHTDIQQTSVRENHGRDRRDEKPERQQGRSEKTTETRNKTAWSSTNSTRSTTKSCTRSLIATFNILLLGENNVATVEEGRRVRPGVLGELRVDRGGGPGGREGLSGAS